MLCGEGLTQELWLLPVDIACYLKNQSPKSPLVNKILHEV